MNEVPFDLQVVEDIAAAVHPLVHGAGPKVWISDRHSNLLAEVRFGDGRTLMVKQARYAEMATRFNTSRLAARLLREEAGMLAPVYLDLYMKKVTLPVLAYWRIPDPSLDEVWQGLDEAARRIALKSWGALIQRIQRVHIGGCGPLLLARQMQDAPAVFLRRDLEDRLFPTVENIWPSGEHAVLRLLSLLHELDSRTSTEQCVLIHNDLFAANVLCEPIHSGVECVGVIDLEDAFAGPPEAELAKTEILHGPLFKQYWAGAWFEPILEGYDEAVDPVVMSVFRAYHLMNMGFHAACTGLSTHAEEVAAAIESEIDAAGTGRRHQDVVRA